MPYIKQVEASEEPAPTATGKLFDLVTDEAESAETPEAEPTAVDDAPPVTGTNGEAPSVTVYTLESQPLPATSDEPNLGGIRFTETPPSQPITPAQPPVEQPLSQTPDLAQNASREVIQPVARTTEGDLQVRNQRISQFTRKLKTPGGLADLEAEPAYKRRQVILDDIDHSSKSQVSRFTLHEETDEEGERTIELRNDNPFLHDNVD
jgi:cell division protein FtsZ